MQLESLTIHSGKFCSSSSAHTTTHSMALCDAMQYLREKERCRRWCTGMQSPKVIFYYWCGRKLGIHTHITKNTKDQRQRITTLHSSYLAYYLSTLYSPYSLLSTLTLDLLLATQPPTLSSLHYALNSLLATQAVTWIEYCEHTRKQTTCTCTHPSTLTTCRPAC